MIDINEAASKVSDLLVASPENNEPLTDRKANYMRYLGYEPTEDIMRRSVREMTVLACADNKKTPEQCVAMATLIFT